jgi:cell wall-associated NlpC family hydrolase
MVTGAESLAQSAQPSVAPSPPTAAPVAKVAPVRPAPTSSLRKTYLVRKGDSLPGIARRFGVDVRKLAKTNHLKSVKAVPVGRTLTLPAPVRKPTYTPPAANPSADGFVGTALQYQGVPYRYGGMTSRGIDCSGLVARVLQTYGIRAPHHAASLYHMGTAVAKEDLQSGDLVFFHTTRAPIGHVGVFIGDGQFVHASSGGGRVMVSKLSERYYASRFVGARRVQ